LSCTINASNSGFGGIVSTGDSSGELQLQTAGTTALTIDTSQRAAFVAGTAALPAITTTGDTNTGMFFPAADTIAFAEGGAESMRIDSSGRVTISAQPRFLAERSGNQTGYNSTSTGDVVVIYNQTIQNIGSHFNTATGKFTAPVAGMYIFQASAYSLGGTNFTQAWLVVNGARANYIDQVYSTTGATIFSATFLIYLSANDTVGYHSYNNTDTNQTITAATNHTWFKGYLIS
jgi:hypothetical protein